MASLEITSFVAKVTSITFEVSVDLLLPWTLFHDNTPHASPFAPRNTVTPSAFALAARFEAAHASFEGRAPSWSVGGAGALRVNNCSSRDGADTTFSSTRYDAMITRRLPSALDQLRARPGLAPPAGKFWKSSKSSGRPGRWHLGVNALESRRA